MIAKQRGILDKLANEGRDSFTSLEKEQYEKLDAEFDKLTDQTQHLEHLKKLEEREYLMKQPVQADGPIKPDLEGPDGGNSDSIEMRGFRRFLRGGIRILVDEELRALQADLDPQGGFLVAPEQFSRELIKEMAELFWIRQFATVISVPNAASLGMPVRQAQMGDPTWTAEIKTGTSDDELSLFQAESLPPSAGEAALW